MSKDCCYHSKERVKQGSGPLVKSLPGDRAFQNLQQETFMGEREWKFIDKWEIL